MDTLPPKQFRQIVRKIMSLVEDSRPADSKAIKGFSFRSVSVGEYRIIYREEGDCIKIYSSGKRNDDAIYKILKNM